MNQSTIAATTLLLLRQELSLAYRHATELMNPVLFFIIVLTLFPLAISPLATQLRLIAPGIIWVTALLATLLSLERLFRHDFAEGTLEQWLLSSYPVPLMVLVKVLAHWLVTGLPLVILAPLLSQSMNLSAPANTILIISLLLGTPILSLVGAIGAALTLGLRNGAVLLTLIVLPLYIPVLIFGASAVAMADEGLVVLSQLLLLGALLVLALCLAPLATAAALRVGVAQ